MRATSAAPFLESARLVAATGAAARMATSSARAVHLQPRHNGKGRPSSTRGDCAPLIERSERALEPTHVARRHHYDHVCEVDALKARWPDLQVLISAASADLLGTAATARTAPLRATTRSRPVRPRTSGRSRCRPLHSPASTGGLLPRRGSEQPGAVFTGDTLSKDSVGHRKRGQTRSYSDPARLIIGTLMELPPDTVIHPATTTTSSLAASGKNAASSASGAASTRRAPSPAPRSASRPRSCCSADYDGGTKAWVRWQDGGRHRSRLARRARRLAPSRGRAA